MFTAVVSFDRYVDKCQNCHMARYIRGLTAIGKVIGKSACTVLRWKKQLDFPLLIIPCKGRLGWTYVTTEEQIRAWEVYRSALTSRWLATRSKTPRRRRLGPSAIYKDPAGPVDPRIPLDGGVLGRGVADGDEPL